MAAMSNDEFFTSGLHPGAQLGPYRIEATLGSGGMGAVFRARDTRLGRTVAIKVIRPEFSQRADFHVRSFYNFLRYASSAARSSGVGRRSKFTPSVVAIGGTTAVGPGTKFTSARLNSAS